MMSPATTATPPLTPLLPSPFHITTLPPEILLHTLQYLDIPDLLSLTRTSHLFRTLCFDPLLHSSRLHRASLLLSPFLEHRPELKSLMQQRVYITRTTLVARRLGWELLRIRLSRKLRDRVAREELERRGVLVGAVGVAPALVGPRRGLEKERVRIRLNRMLERRPPVEELVHRGVLPERKIAPALVGAKRGLERERVRIKLNRKLERRPGVEELVQKGVLPSGKIAPGLVGVRGRLEREKVRDFLRGWVVVLGERVGKRNQDLGVDENGNGKVEVRRIVRRFGEGSRDGREAPRWGRGRGVDVKSKEEPTRAKVLGLRRFWEKVGKEGVGS